MDSLNRGGGETMMLDVCRNVHRCGLDLTFVATGGGDLEEDFRNSGVPFIGLHRSLPVDVSLAAELRRIIKQRGIQVVHGHQPIDGLHLYLATRREPVKRVLTIHGFYPGAKNELALKFIWPRLDARVLVSNDLLSRLLEKGITRNRNTMVIRNGVDAARLKVGSDGLREELGIPDDEFLMGMIANFQPVAQKDQLTVCKALPRFFERVPGSRFIFVGARSDNAPHLFDECVEFCRAAKLDDRVMFLGKRSDISRVLSSLDLFVLSSRREGSPISVIEAMMMGVPTVLSNIPALREVSNDGKFAVLFHLGDSIDLADRLIDLANDVQKRRSLAASARVWAHDEFGIDRHISDLKKLYESLTAMD